MLKRSLAHKELVSANADYQKAAVIADLRYINSCDEGIKRNKTGSSFTYSYRNKNIRDPATLERIKKLAIPPSWKKVWICPSGEGHIQATGFDSKKRKQYKYHPEWNRLRAQTKFHSLLEFGKALPELRRKVQRDINSGDLNENKVLAAVIKILEETHIRVGNYEYEKLYGSYGLTTLKDKHVTIRKSKTLFSFAGKKGIRHEVVLNNKRLAAIIRQCRDIPGKELFQYYDGTGQKRSVDSGMVNRYIREATGSDFSAKDFRTWAGSLYAIQCFQKMDRPVTPAGIKKNITAMLAQVSNKLGNTVNICKKYYIHPAIIAQYEKNKLFPCFKRCKIRGIAEKWLKNDEKRLLYFLHECV